MGSNLVAHFKWKTVTGSYTSPSEENNKYKALYNLTPQQVFLFDWIDDMSKSDPTWLELKVEKLEELETLRTFNVNKLGGAL